MFDVVGNNFERGRGWRRSIHVISTEVASFFEGGPHTKRRRGFLNNNKKKDWCYILQHI